MFKQLITEKENECVEMLKKCKQSGLETYIYGAGQAGHLVEKRFANFKFAGKVVNRNYWSSSIDALCLEDLVSSSDKRINLVIAFKGYDFSLIEKYRDAFEYILDYDCFAENSEIEPEMMDYKYVSEHEEDFDRVYNMLEDELSRKVLVAYVNQKISMRYGYMKKVMTSPQYFEKEIVQLGGHETFVDCGAYNGDSALEFIEALKNRGITSYDRIISFEPDPDNYDFLIKRNLDKHICFMLGTSDCKKELRFSTGGTGSGISNEGDIIINVDSIDNMVQERVSFIKMDIEGAELDSLRGAKNRIINDKPKLAICIYHKREDLWTIIDYINSICNEYKFYIRAYAETATEVVLYAIPDNV